MNKVQALSLMHHLRQFFKLLCDIRFLIILFILIRVLIFLFLHCIDFTFLGEDTMDYVSTSHSIVEGEGFVSLEHNPSNGRENLGDNYYFVAEPLWVIVLLPLVGVGMSDIATTITANTVMFVLLLWLSYLIGRKLNLSKNLLSILILVLLLNPYLQFWSFKGVPELLRINTFLCFLFLLLCMTKHANTKTLILLGISSAALLLSKITFILMPILILPILIKVYKSKKYVFLYLVTFLLVLSPWIYRNYHDFGLITLDTRLNMTVFEKLFSKDQLLTKLRITNSKEYRELLTDEKEKERDKLIVNYDKGASSWISLYILRLSELFKPYPGGGSFFQQYSGPKILVQIYSFIFWVPWITGILLLFLKRITEFNALYIWLVLAISSTIGIHLTQSGHHSRYMLFLIPLGYCSTLLIIQQNKNRLNK